MLIMWIKYFVKIIIARSLVALALLFMASTSVFSTEAVAATPTASSSKPVRDLRVLTSIKPLQLIIASLIAEGDQLELLMDSASSPHSYTIKPSDARKIRRADVIVWVGEDLESNLVKVLGNFNALKNNSSTVEIMELMVLLEKLIKGQSAQNSRAYKFDLADYADYTNYEGAGQDSKASKGSKKADRNSHNHDHADHNDADVHIWLYPPLVERVAFLVSEKLQAMNPSKEQEYQKNLQVFTEQLKIRMDLLSNKLTQFDGAGFASIHNGFELFANFFSLNYGGYIMDEHSAVFSPKQLSHIRQKILDEELNCIFEEPLFNSKALDGLTTLSKVNRQEVDILGGNIGVSAQGYFVFMDKLVADTISCMGG